MSRINFDLRKIRAVAFDVDGVLSPTTVPMSEDGVPMRMANLKDGYAIKQAVDKGIKVAIISGAFATGITGRFGLIGVRDIYLGVGHKLPVFLEWAEREGLSPEEIAYVGDDIPDLEVLKACGLPVAPRDACAEVKAVAKFISGANGGYGVARELMEEILKAKGLWPTSAKAFGI